MSNIKCPHCGHQISIDEVYAHSIEERIRTEEKSKHLKELEEAKSSSLKVARAAAEKELSLTIKTLRDSLAEEQGRGEKLTKTIEELSKELRHTRHEKEDMKIEMQKKLSEEEDKIRREAVAKYEEERSLKDREKDKMIEDLKKSLLDAQKKAEQGSQQTQGEVLELEIEEVLQREFPMDRITEVKKGARGADVTQIVINNGHECGTILWESKNAVWSNTWIPKLKEDKRTAKAHLAVLVATEPPPGIKDFGYREGVWVVTRALVSALATALRYNLVSLAHIRAGQEGKKEKSEILYSYITSVEFRGRIEAIVDAFSDMQTELEREKRWFQTKWARQEKYLRQVVDHTQGMYGDLQGVVGKSLPELTNLDASQPSLLSE